MKLAAVGAIAFAALVPVAASAGSLYPAGVAPSGHILRLGPDLRASQVGDLVHVVFNFSAANTNTQKVADGKSFSGNIGNATGIGTFGLGFMRLPNGLSGSSSYTNSQSAQGVSTFTSDMMAQVVGVLPSGALEISGDQALVVNGQKQVLHVTGIVRPEDIDSTDSVLSTRVADVQATFSGDYQSPHEGILKRILDWLF